MAVCAEHWLHGLLHAWQMPTCVTLTVVVTLTLKQSWQCSGDGNEASHPPCWHVMNVAMDAARIVSWVPLHLYQNSNVSFCSWSV